MTTTYTITSKQIEQAAQEMVKITEWGYEIYNKVNGEWQLDHLLVPEECFKRTHKVYPDGRETEIIQWAQ